ncbi:hypothetical protein [Dietzia sp. NCCP-2495]|uniref:hypothetical protein n=1 Tax=Dietzia sp. NCCP-2495 TaxID=2934675 RepID=UPI002231A80D|nr:hypothetical protein [Dietzia sp. NCCP-2495]
MRSFSVFGAASIQARPDGSRRPPDSVPQALAIVWCWAGVEEGKDLFYFVDQA